VAFGIEVGTMTDQPKLIHLRVGDLVAEYAYGAKKHPGLLLVLRDKSQETVRERVRDVFYGGIRYYQVRNIEGGAEMQIGYPRSTVGLYQGTSLQVIRFDTNEIEVFSPAPIEVLAPWKAE
jgi:hypothetical protein